MSKWVSVEIEDSTYEAYQDESIRRTRADGKRTTIAVVVKTELNRGAQRLRNKSKKVIS